MKTRHASAAVLGSICALVASGATDVAFAQNGSPNDPRAKDFVKEVNVDRVERHQASLQEIADRNGGTRVVFGGGFTESVDYVVRVLQRAGYDPQVTPFNYPLWEETQLPAINLVAPTAKTYRPGTSAQDNSPDVDFISFPGSPTASQQGVPVVPAGGIVIPSPGGSQSGCAAADYPAAVRGAVALVQRGTCALVDKWQLAQDAGAVGIIIFNEGDTPDRQNARFLETQLAGATIPAVFRQLRLRQGAV